MMPDETAWTQQGLLPPASQQLAFLPWPGSWCSWAAPGAADTCDNFHLIAFLSQAMHSCRCSEKL